MKKYIENKNLDLTLWLTFTFSLFYALTNRLHYDVAQIFQGLICITLIFSYFTVIKKMESSFFALIVFMCTPLFIYFQKAYALNLIVFIILIDYARKTDPIKISKYIIYYSLAFSILSLIFYYVFKGYGLYNYIEYENQIIPFATRLLSLDGSPVGLSLVAMTGVICLVSFEPRSQKNVFLICFLILIIILTGSRLVLFSILFGSLFLFLKLRLLSFICLIVFLSPLVITFLYNHEQASFIELGIYEKITSYRVVNWTNALEFYLDSSLGNIVFGLGHLPKLDVAYLNKSLFDGHYIYRFVTYTESGILRLLINYGLLFFVMFFFFCLNKIRKMKNRKCLFGVMVILSAAILYDPVFSVQYFFIFLVFYSLLYKEKECDILK